MRLRSASLFAAVSLIELPTVVLAVGSLRQRWRSDFLFAFSFFVLRLLFHAWMIVALKQHHRIQSLWIIAVGVFGLHVYWFGCIIRQQIRLHSEYTLKRISGITVAKRKQNVKRQHNLLDKVFAI
ncbi:hypothetical protein EC973_005941 [Apophysomyces ossiformis]|uniref:Uncharacterized protein n=1 Tax=Apophysomyces ossiformis TaxID=679940 RepID=A0A8H7BNZ0_9FUNG|nr:hypothetical protein EC973_005941 [Apophysomyces ossiformis]